MAYGLTALESGRSRDNVGTEFDLATYYLNKRRLSELAGTAAVASALSSVGPGISARAQESLELAACKQVLLAWLGTNPNTVRPIEELLLLDRVTPGALFTVVRSFYCSGVRAGRTSKPPIMHTKIAALRGEAELRFKLHREHVAPGSPGDLLSGRAPSLFVVGVVDHISNGVIEAIPIAIGKPVVPTADLPLVSPYDCEVHVDHIDSFAKCAAEPIPNEAELRALWKVPEIQVKTAFAEIIGEPLVPKDWGGERSDLFTSYLRLGARRISAAFAFKGPARPHPMSLFDLGVRGDQIIRLVSEPADVFILQHCHEVRAEVRHMLRTYSLHHGHKYCVITGFDTIRVLAAYSKCGFRSHARPRDTVRRSPLARSGAEE